MKKEMIIVSIIVVATVILNIVCQRYTNKTISIMNGELEELRGLSTEALKNNNNIELNENIKNKSSEIQEKWNKYNQKLSFYIEHDELEKVDTSMVTLNSYIELEEYDEAIPEIKKCSFILTHIKEKEIMKITNLF